VKKHVCTHTPPVDLRLPHTAAAPPPVGVASWKDVKITKSLQVTGSKLLEILPLIRYIWQCHVL
jgi:hypothetical protein